MKKNLFWSSIASTIFLVINLIVFIVLSCLNLFEVRMITYFMMFGFLVVSWIPFFLHLWLKLEINLPIIISYHVFMVLSIIVGSVWRVYSYWAPYDIIIHFASGVLIALIAYVFFAKSNKVNLFWLFIIVFSIAMMCGGVWEIWEFVTDILFGNDAQVSAGLIGRAALMDTMTDIICDFAGGILGGIIVIILESFKKKKKAFQTEEMKISDNEGFETEGKSLSIEEQTEKNLETEEKYKNLKDE